MKCRTCGKELISMHVKETEGTIYVCMNRCRKQLPLGYRAKSFVSDLLALVLFAVVLGCGILFNLFVRITSYMRSVLTHE